MNDREMLEARLFTGGNIVTMAGADLGPDAAVLVHGERIVAVGPRKSLRTLLPRELVHEHDLAGRTLLPAFVDAHAHPLMFGQMNAWVDVSPANVGSIPALVKVLGEAERALPADVPLRAFGYEHRNLEEGRHPTRWELDEVSREREIYVMNASGHGGVVNSHALESRGIGPSTPDPEGGSFERDGNGELTGVLWDAACDALTGLAGVKIGNHGPNFHLPDSQAALTAQLLQAEEEFLAHGVGTIGDAQASQREIETYLDAVGRSGLRARYHLYVTSSLLPQLSDLGLATGFGSERLSINGVKLYADGTLGGWTAYFPEGYAADPCRHGQLYHAPEEYEELFLLAAARGLQVATHAQSPTAIDLVLDAAAKAATRESRRAGLRPRIEHCGLPELGQIARMAQLGAIAVSQPQHHYNWGDGVVTAVGPDLGNRFNPLGDFVRAGVDFALSSDAPVARPRPLQAVMAAVTRRTSSGSILGDESLRIPVRAALEAHTLGGARALGRADRLGSIEAGKAADLVVLSENPLTLAPEELPRIGVAETWVGGRLAWSA